MCIVASLVAILILAMHYLLIIRNLLDIDIAKDMYTIDRHM